MISSSVVIVSVGWMRICRFVLRIVLVAVLVGLVVVDWVMVVYFWIVWSKSVVMSWRYVRAICGVGCIECVFLSAVTRNVLRCVSRRSGCRLWLCLRFSLSVGWRRSV